jgi:outer membrane protein TolC
MVSLTTEFEMMLESSFFNFKWVPVALICSVSLAQAARADDYQILKNEVLSNSTQVKTAKIKFEQSQDRLGQAKGKFLPTVSLNYTLTSRDQANSIPSAGGPGGSRVETEERTTSVTKVQLSQNLYNGNQDKSRFDQRLIEVEQAQLELKTAVLEQSLALTKSFFKIVSIQRDIKNYVADIKVQMERLQEVRARLRSGLARASDVSSIEAASLTSRSSLAQSQGDLEAEWANLENIVGRSLERKNLTYLSNEKPLESKELSWAVLGNPEVKANKLAMKGQEAQLIQQKAQLRPSVDLSANAYLDRTGNALNDSKWDASLSVTVPWPWGFERNATLSESVRAVGAKEVSAAQREKQIRADLEILSRGLVSARSRLAISSESLQVQTKNEANQRADFLRGLTSSAEYLNALLNLQASVRSRDQIEVDVQNKENQLNLYFQAAKEE